MDLREAYRLLDLAVGASEDAVREARKTLAKVWHPDRHANDPDLAKKAQQKLADINAAFETIRDAKFPASLPDPKPAAPSREGPAPTPPPPVDSQIEFVPRRRVRWSVILILAAALGVGAYFAIVRLGDRTQTVEPRRDPPPPIADARVPTPNGAFTLGSTPDDVRAAQGEPTDVADALGIWHYGFSTVEFKRGVVAGFWNTDSNLHIHLDPADGNVAAKAVAAGSFAVGSSKDEVIALQGIPEHVESVIDETWHYPGGSSVSFDTTDHVKRVSDFGGELKLRR